MQDTDPYLEIGVGVPEDLEAEWWAAEQARRAPFVPILPDPGGAIVITTWDNTGRGRVDSFGAIAASPAIFARFKAEQEGRG